jgi:signal transduction histidine kinase
MAAAMSDRAGVLQVALWSIGLVTPLGLLAGLVAFRQVTRPIVQLTREVQALEGEAASQQPTQELDPDTPAKTVRDEITILRVAFERLAGANARHWQHQNQQDQQRREWVANISHDLRTPLASMQGYLETVLLKSAALSVAEREQYLRAALAQSQRLSRLAQELLELAHLELGTVKPTLERFSMVELVQDVMQKLALSASSRQQRLVPLFGSGSLDVVADIGMMERVMTNLLDNAIRHTPPGGEIAVRMQAQGDRVRVDVADGGPGIPPDVRPLLFTRGAAQRPGREGGGLGLAIVRQILQLHGSDITLGDGPGGGAVFVFLLPTQT